MNVLPHKPARGPRPTTLIEAAALSERLGAQLVLASETFQYTGSFKFRAAYNVARKIPHPAVVTASSGNFGQAIAFACRLMAKRCTVVMPTTASRVKIEAVRAFGATADLVDTASVRREERVALLAAQQPDAYVASAYDDELVIDGNATLGAELAALEKSLERAFDYVIAPVGGGGLTSGLIRGLRAAGSTTAVVGAEPALGNDAAESLRRGELFTQEREPDTLADGARTRALGRHNWEVLRDGIEGIVEVPEDQIRAGVRLLFSMANLKAEPTGALGIGAMLTEPERFRGKRVCCVVSGGNVDSSLYSELVGGPA